MYTNVFTKVFKKRNLGFILRTEDVITFCCYFSSQKNYLTKNVRNNFFGQYFILYWKYCCVKNIQSFGYEFDKFHLIFRRETFQMLRVRPWFPAAFRPPLPHGLHPLGQEGVSVRVLWQGVLPQVLVKHSPKDTHGSPGLQVWDLPTRIPGSNLPPRT